MTVKRLLGSAPSQVSRNRDLGTMAFQDVNNFKGPVFRVYPSTAQSCANLTAVRMASDTKLIDTHNVFNATGSTVVLNGLSVPAYSFCPNVAGYYCFTGTNIFYGSSGVSQPVINKYNSAGTGQDTVAAATALNTGGVNPTVTAIFYLNGMGDYVSYSLYQTSGSTLSILAGRPDQNYFQGFMIRGA